MSSEEAAETTGPDVQDIEFEELKQGLVDDGSLILIDVRDPEELQTQGKIPKAINIQLPEIPDAFRLPDEEFTKKYGFSKNASNLVFSCRSGRRAEAAINHVFNGNSSITKFRLYRGSFMDWEQKGGPIEK